MSTKVILDVDTGTDDAVALLHAAFAPELELVAATTVNGNRPVDQTTENTLRVFDYVGLSVPVYKGCPLPITATLTPGRKPDIPRRGPGLVHGIYLDLPESRSRIQEQHAIDFLIEYYMGPDGPDTILVPVGPLTNIAMAIKKEPRILERIPRMVIMGGNHAMPNYTMSAEYNFWVDPEAAHIVMACGVPIVLVPLDATHDALITLDDCARFRTLGTQVGEAAARLIERRIEGYRAFQPMDDPNAAPVHDALCTAYLIDPSVLTHTETCYVEVEINAGINDARSVCDFGNRSKREPTAVVALKADRSRFVSLLTDAFKSA